jgi:hypothetical protein
MTVYDFQNFQRMDDIFRKECEDGSSLEAILHSSDDQHFSEKRTSKI